MKFKLTEISTGKIIGAPKGGYDRDSEGILVGLDGRLYRLVNDGACGDPDCCGEVTYYYEDVTEKYIIELVKEGGK